MSFEYSDLQGEISNYCADIGAQPLLVQGAGGNVSWKDADVLWVKASGTWLADAVEQSIFVPVDLVHLREAIQNDQFDVKPVVVSESGLRPSIETLLHALMPQRIVVHVHAIEVLAHLVRASFPSVLNQDSIPGVIWTSVGYHKPGAALACAVARGLNDRPGVNVIFLQNHGVVIGAATVGEVASILNALTERLRVVPRAAMVVPPLQKSIRYDDTCSWIPANDPVLHQLAIDPALFKRVQEDWALCPDHVVFMGARAVTVDDVSNLRAVIEKLEVLPDILFLESVGVFVGPGFNKAKEAQIRCYYDVIVRQGQDEKLNSLSDQNICELLNWDAERYRMRLAK
ncbi:class II aldolase [Pseudomonas sp. P66]|uniref:Class II aldolase n=1 Tax=Pseudomonas arcuscaelestis TaxID=2710591 RepID=A0ABS2C6Q2_9PSED|nr:class II aldolase/adducin family protein [Pseudomonas arcuscaelestis]MBM5461557.1 class II aldolase [Pseudomonas arcuscaelestis]